MGQEQKIKPALLEHISALENEFDTIDSERKKALAELSEQISSQLSSSGESHVTFICTHNSRRSQLSEIWLRTAAAYYGLEGIHSYSGGTEATAFNSRMVSAVQRFGFDLRKLDENENARYRLYIGDRASGTELFSKIFDNGRNPQENFIAVMVCSDADENCPVVAGAESRMALPYLDPKRFDDTHHEATAYDNKIREIGRELLYSLSLLSAER